MSFPACFWLPLDVVDTFSCYMYVYVSVLEVRYRLLMQIVCVWVELTCNTLDCMCSPMYETWGWNLSRYHICLIPLPTSQNMRTDCGRLRVCVCVCVQCVWASLSLCSLSLFCDPRSFFRRDKGLLHAMTVPIPTSPSLTQAAGAITWR